MVVLSTERFCCPEALFKPEVIGVRPPGVHQLVHFAINACNPDFRRELYANVVTAGGTTLFEGFTKQLE